MKATPEVVEARLRNHARSRWPKIAEVRVRSRAGYLYVDVKGPDDEAAEPLLRLRHLGGEDWEFAFFSWSAGGRGRFEGSYLDDGRPFGTPERCFDCAASPFFS